MTIFSTSAVTPVRYSIGGKVLAGLQLGNSQLPVVLCLHGWLDNAASFTPVFKQIQLEHVHCEHRHQPSESLLSRYQFIAIDWPGHGLSEHRSEDAQYHFVDWLYDILQLIDAQQSLFQSDENTSMVSPWAQVHLIGHSMGGMVAGAFTSAFPEKIKSLTLIEAIGLITLSQNPAAQLKQGLLSRLKSKKKKKTLHKTVASAVQSRVNVSDLPQPCAQLIVERALIENSDGYAWRSDHRLRTISAQRFTENEAVDLFKNILCPVRVITGDNGFDTIRKGIDIFAPHLLDFKQYQIKGGHHPHMESPKDLVDLIVKFLR